MSDDVSDDNAPDDDPQPENVVDLDARRRAAEAVRDQVLDVDRVDVARIVAEKAKAIRDEHGFSWEATADGLPPGCPVTPLGKKGGTFWFLTPDCELMGMPAGQFGQAHIDALFAPQSAYVVAMWGATSRSNKTRVQYETVRRDLMDACARKGVFDPADKIRGRGAWRDPDGGLVVHYGDRVVIDGQARAPGAYGDHVYPAAPKLPPPKGDGRSDGRAAARALLALLEQWHWSRGRIDAHLLLGWIVASMMGAAIDWRPQIMLTGDAGMGKSTLQRVLKLTLGERLLDVADASAAGIYQTLGFDALGVAFDEFENEDEARGAAVMRLARLASSGARLVRGGADGVPSNYQARGAFLFSAINPPAMRPAEQSRTTILALRPPAVGARAPAIDERGLAEIGANLAARVVAMWPFWEERLTSWREYLGAMRHTNRAQDQLGTLLAAADLALSDQGGVGGYDDFAADLAPGRMIETAGASANWRRCLNHILGVQPDAWRALAHKQIGAALQRFFDPPEAPVSDDPYADNAASGVSLPKLREHLALCGLALVHTRADDGADVYWLGFPGRHPGLAKCFEGTDWSARRGADGAWINALAQAPDGTWRRDRFRVGGARDVGVLVRLDVVLDIEEA